MARPKRIGVYKITHADSGRCYVGSSADIDRRWQNHKSDFRGHRHHSPYFERVWDKYGEDAFIFETLEECALSVLFDREQHWIDSIAPVFNSAPVAGSPLGYKHTAESIANMVASRTHVQWDEDQRREISERMLGNTNCVGRVPTSQHRAKTSATLKGKPKSPEHIAKLIGHEVSPETRVKISAAQKAAWERRRANAGTDSVPPSRGETSSDCVSD